MKKKLLLLLLLAVGLSVWSNPPFSSPAPPPDPACDGKCGRTGEDDGEDDIDGEDDSDGDDPVYCLLCGTRLNSLEETLPFGRMVDCKLISNALFFLYSKSPSVRLFSPQGLGGCLSLSHRCQQECNGTH
mgnify:FL=1